MGESRGEAKRAATDGEVARGRVGPQADSKSSRAEETRYHELFENANDLVFTVGLDGRFTSANRKAEQITKFTREEMVGSEFTLLVPEQYIDKVREMMNRKIANHEHTIYEIEIRTKEGQLVPVEISSRLIYENDRPVEIQGIARDISERKQAERSLKQTVEELRRSNQELKQFAAVASHDMRAPLRRIITLSQLVKEANDQGEYRESNQLLGLIEQSASQMRELIEDLLAHSEIGAGRKPLVSVDCQTAAEEAISNLGASIVECDAVVDVGPLPTVWSRKSEVVRLFQNLVANAIQYRKAKPPVIEIGAEKMGEEWLFRVKDNGVGIDAKDQQKVFDAFCRLHSDLNPGTGLGLATCKKIVEGAAGRIWVESQLGKGSTFFFTFSASPGASSKQDG